MDEPLLGGTRAPAPPPRPTQTRGAVDAGSAPESKKERFWRAALAGDMDTIRDLHIHHRVYVSAAMALAMDRHANPTRPIPRQWLLRLAPYMPRRLVKELGLQ